MNTNPLQFRAWNGHKMVRVDSLSFNAGGMIWHGPGEFGWGWVDENFAGWTKDNPKPEVVNPVMRWTGLVDKTGTMIYEGDIVRETWQTNNPYGYSPDDWDERDRVTVVEYYEGRHNLEWEVGDGGQYCVQEYAREVVGNRYENPDLLKS